MTHCLSARHDRALATGRACPACRQGRQTLASETFPLPRRYQRIFDAAQASDPWVPSQEMADLFCLTFDPLAFLPRRA